MRFGFARNPPSHRQSVCLILITCYMLANNIFINAVKRRRPPLICQEKMLFTDDTTTFAVDLLSAVIEKNMSNSMVFSSFPIQTCLGLIELGTDPKNCTHLRKYVLTDREFEGILQLYERNNNGSKIARKFFYKNGASILPSFYNSVVSLFRSTIDEINIEYDSDLRNHLSTELKNEGMPSTKTTLAVQSNGDMRLAFMTLMNFSKEWFHKFSINDTKLEEFIATTRYGTTLRYVQMMNIVEYFDCAPLMDLKAHVIKLPFSDKRMSMLIFAPRFYRDLPKLQKELTARKIKEIVGNLVQREVSVKLPKFSVDGSYHYTDALSEMGLECIYCAKMDMLNSREFLRVESIVQRNKFVVNEAGINKEDHVEEDMNYQNVEATSKTFEFHANRPFIFFIQDNEGHTFYAGKVTDLP